MPLGIKMSSTTLTVALMLTVPVHSMTEEKPKKTTTKN